MYMESPSPLATGFLVCSFKPTKSRTPYNKSGCGFFVAFSETVSRFPLCKDFVNLRSKIL